MGSVACSNASINFPTSAGGRKKKIVDFMWHCGRDGAC